MIDTLVPHAQVAERARAELERLAPEIAAHEQQLAEMDARLQELAEQSRARAEALHLAYRQQETARSRCMDARIAARLSKDTDAEASAIADLTSLELTLEQAESRYGALEKEHQALQELATQESRQLETERFDVQVRLDALYGIRASVQAAHDNAQRAAGDELYADLAAQAMATINLRDASQATASAYEDSLRSQYEKAAEQLSPYPALLRQYEQAFVPVDDVVTRRLQAALAYRRALLAMMADGNGWHLGLPVRWFLPQSQELASPADRMGAEIREIERELARHIAVTREL